MGLTIQSSTNIIHGLGLDTGHYDNSYRFIYILSLHVDYMYTLQLYEIEFIHDTYVPYE